MQRNGKKKEVVSQLFWQKAFDMDFPQKLLNGELPLLRNAQKRHKKK
jgi:hypothetical protein